ncbi:MAG: T9SS type A sorting domain-containing protein, partial [Bacteroidota bacterium]|nr:T9SS type A sorting domain-containing protein [Bacteroidota bacterium]
QIIVLNKDTLVAVYGTRNSATSGSAVYTASSGVFYSNDGGLTWADNNPSFMQIETVNIEIDPNDLAQNTWLAFVGNKSIKQVQSAPGVYRSTNRGVNWINVYNQSALSGTFHPTLPNELYICTEVMGLQYATNTNSDSFSTNNVASYPFRRPQKIFFNPYNVNEVWASSFGNGFRVGTTNITTGFFSYNSAIQNTPILYPNPTAGNLSFSQTLYDIEVFNIYGQSVLEKIKTAKNISVQELLDGIYFIRTGNFVLKFIVKH